MNRSLFDIKGGLLIVPQFTLPADTNKGTRPSFAPAASPELGKQLFDYFIKQAENKLGTVGVGQFGADMQVKLINNGPATFWLQC
jgi:D-tyrosyl-tRNA(Tyr) deacylase